MRRARVLSHSIVMRFPRTDGPLDYMGFQNLQNVCLECIESAVLGVQFLRDLSVSSVEGVDRRHVPSISAQ